MSENLTERIEAIADAYKEIETITQQIVVGNRPLIELIFISMINGGHLLIEGVPGTAKTTICKIIARLIDFDFKRVQGAVDIQPADIIGVRVFDQTRKEFILRKGPIFTNLLMVDEINRLTPKTQSALLEALSEGQTTIDGITYTLANPYFAIATQNPYEVEGTFPLIDAQRDRFMFSFILSHLDAESELEILQRERAGDLDWNTYHDRITPLLGPVDIKDMITTAREIMIDEKVLEYARDIILATRSHSDVVHGASSRASIAFLRGARARAAIEGRDYAIPDDVRALAHPVLRHRILLTREAVITGVDPDTVISEILESTGVS